MIVAVYIAAIALANVLTAELNPILWHVDDQVIAITAGTFAIGATFFLRDLVQRQYGLRAAYLAIAAALAVNLALSVAYDDLLENHARLSGGARRLRARRHRHLHRRNGHLGKRILWSGLVNCPLDSAIFVIFGLSPLTTGIIGWDAVALTILAQAAIKVSLQIVAAVPAWRVATA